MKWTELLMTFAEIVGATLVLCVGVVALVTISSMRRRRLYMDGGMDIVDTMSKPQFSAFVRHWMTRIELGQSSRALDTVEAAFICEEGNFTYFVVALHQREAVSLRQLQDLHESARRHAYPLHLITNSGFYPEAEKWARKNNVRITGREKLISLLGSAKTRHLAEKCAGDTRCDRGHRQ
ncbi:MAG: restriction endonuclease [Burkholderiales bacterium]